MLMIDLTSFWLGALVTALIMNAALGAGVLVWRFLSRRMIIELDAESEPEPAELESVAPRVVPRSYPFSRN